MDDNNQRLAKLLSKYDNSDWMYNKHCPSCNKFLYPDELSTSRCKRCRSKLDNALKHPLPFCTSASAIEKLIVWANKNDHTDLLNTINNIIRAWMLIDNSHHYKQEIVLSAISYLLNTQLIKNKK